MLIGRTVLGEVARNFVAALVATTGVAFFMLSLTALKSTPGVGLGFLLEVFPLFFPLALQFTVPLAALSSVIMVFGRMSGDGELTALSASGISLLRVIRPVLASAALVALAALLLTDALAPLAAARLRSAKRDLIHQLETSFRAGLSDLDLGHGRISFERFDGQGFVDVCVEWEGTPLPGRPQDEGELRLFRARRGSIAITDDEQVVLLLQDVRGAAPYETRQGEWQVEGKDIAFAASLDDLTGTGGMNRKRTDLAAWELAYVGERGLDRVPGARTNSSGAMEELARRGALAGSAFFFALIGIPLGILSGRGGKPGAFLLMVAPVLVVFFPIVIGGSNLARSGRLPAYPALWAGNLVLFVAALLMLRKVMRR